MFESSLSGRKFHLLQKLGEREQRLLRRRRVQPCLRGSHEAVSEQLKDNLRRDSKAIIFSDSLFLTLYRLPDTMAFARGLMWRVLDKRIPSRIAIAQGSFSTLRYDLTLLERPQSIRPTFLGTGVVRAYQAERAVKAKIAISIDESVRPFAGDFTQGEVMELPAPEGTVFAIGNLLFDSTDNTTEERDRCYKNARRALRAMRKASDPNFYRYYDFGMGTLDQMPRAMRPAVIDRSMSTRVA